MMNHSKHLEGRCYKGLHGFYKIRLGDSSTGAHLLRACGGNDAHGGHGAVYLHSGQLCRLS
ncbi:hypothetical protein QUF76_10765 [Desulfobacterales bacterium HSG16]|nr:hypothetical protein [Desulfobacterales bacterium HSG16]